MGEVVPKECIMNALPANDRSGTLSSSGFQHAWEVLQEVLAAEHAMEGRVAAEEPLMEEGEEDQRRGSSSAGGLVPWQAPLLEWAMPTQPKF